METWATVALVLGSNIIIGLSTFFATKIQVSHADRRFQVEKSLETEKLLRETQERYRQRRREVRSEPLLNLRTELANMATKAEILAKAGFTYATFTQEKQQEDETLKKAIDDWGKYISSGDLNRILHIQSDTELVKLVKEITVEYLNTYNDVVTNKDELPPVEYWIAMTTAEVKLAPKVTQAQELINSRLEEL